MQIHLESIAHGVGKKNLIDTNPKSHRSMPLYLRMVLKSCSWNFVGKNTTGCYIYI
jgi:hypothetical protein